MRKHFLLLFLMALLPLAGWATDPQPYTSQGVTFKVGNATLNVGDDYLTYSAEQKALPVPASIVTTDPQNPITLTEGSSLVEYKWYKTTVGANNVVVKTGEALAKLEDAGTYICEFVINVGNQQSNRTTTLTIEKFDLNVTAPFNNNSTTDGKYHVTYGEALPTNLKATYGDWPTALTDQANDSQAVKNQKKAKRDAAIAAFGTLTFTSNYEAATTAAGAQNILLTPNVTALNSNNYEFVAVSKTIAVDKKALTITGNNATATATVEGLFYNSHSRKALPVVTDKKLGVLANMTTGQSPVVKDYSLTYYGVNQDGSINTTGGTVDPIAAGEYYVRITGENNYTGNIDLKYAISKKVLWVTTKNGADNITYTANAQTIAANNVNKYLIYEGLEDADKAEVENVKVEQPNTAAFISDANGARSIAVELWKNGAKVDAVDADTYDVHAVSMKGAAETTQDDIFKNYRIVYQHVGKYTINPAKISFTIKPQNKKNGQTHPLDAAAGVTPTAANQSDYFTAITDLQNPVNALGVGQAIEVYPTLKKGNKIANTNNYEIVLDFTNVKINNTAAAVNEQPAVVTDVTKNYTFEKDEAHSGVYSIAAGFMTVRPVNLTATYGEFAADEHKAFSALADGGTAEENTAIQNLVADKIEFVKNAQGKIMGTNGTTAVEYPAAGTYTLKINTEDLDLSDWQGQYTFEWFEGATYKINKAPLTITLGEQSLNVGDAANATTNVDGLIADDKTVTIEGLKYDDKADALYDNVVFKFAGHVLDQTAAQTTYYTKNEVYLAKTAIGNMQDDTALGEYYAVLNAVIGADTYSATTLIQNVSRDHKTAMSNATAEQGSNDATTYVKAAVPATPKYLDGNGALIAAAANYNAEPAAAPVKGFFAKAITLDNATVFANYSWTAAAVTNGDLYVSAVNDLALDEKEVTAAATQAHPATTSAKDRLVAANNQKQNVTVKIYRSQAIGGKTRYWNAQQFNLLVLPFDVTVTELAQQFGYAIVNVVNKEKSSEDNVYWSLAWDRIDANTPFVVRTIEGVDANAGKLLSFQNKTIKYVASPSVDAGYGNKVVGTYAPYVIDKTANGKKEFLVDGVQNPIKVDSKATWTIVPFDAYFDYTESTSAREITLTFEDLNGGTTSISPAELIREAMPTTAEGWYTLNGIKLQGVPTEKGVYIQNGKKVVIK